MSKFKSSIKRWTERVYFETIRKANEYDYLYIKKSINLKSVILIAITFLLVNISLAQSYQHKLADSLCGQASKLRDIREYDSAIKNFLRAAQIYERIHEEKDLIGTYNSLGLVYHDLQQYQQSRYFYNKVVQKLEKYPDQQIFAYVLNNLGMLHASQNELDSAVYYYKKCLLIKRNLKDSIGIGHTLNNLGIIMLSKGDFSEAINYNQQSHNIKVLTSDSSGIVASHSNYANIYGSWGKFDSVKFHLDQGMPLARLLTNKSQLLTYHLNYGAYYRAIRQFEQALVYQDSAQILQQEVFSKRLSDNLARYQVSYETEKQKLEIKKQKVQNDLLIERKKKDHKQKQLYLVTAISLSLILGLIFIVLRILIIKNKREQELFQKEIELKEKELLISSNLILQKKEILNSLKKRLDENEDSNESSSEALIRILDDSIRQDSTSDKEWNNFKIHFEKTYDSFFTGLKKHYPILTEGDLRHCAYIKIGMTTKEISSLLNITPGSVQKSRVRLKKKLNLEKEMDLKIWIISQ